MAPTTDTLRREAVREAVGRIRDIEDRLGVTRDSLAEMKSVLQDLASKTELFPRDSFPAPDGRGESILYRLSQDEDDRFALYLNAIAPGKDVAPHNHTTWAIVAAVDGAEINRLYRRTDAGLDAGKAEIVFDREHIVEPGDGIALMPEDIHSIAVEGERPALHLHMYGRALETLTDRVAFNMADGTTKVLKQPTNIRY